MANAIKQANNQGNLLYRLQVYCCNDQVPDQRLFTMISHGGWSSDVPKYLVLKVSI